MLPELTLLCTKTHRTRLTLQTESDKTGATSVAVCSSGHPLQRSFLLELESALRRAAAPPLVLLAAKGIQSLTKKEDAPPRERCAHLPAFSSALDVPVPTPCPTAGAVQPDDGVLSKAVSALQMAATRGLQSVSLSQAALTELMSAPMRRVVCHSNEVATPSPLLFWPAWMLTPGVASALLPSISVQLCTRGGLAPAGESTAAGLRWWYTHGIAQHGLAAALSCGAVAPGTLWHACAAASLACSAALGELPEDGAASAQDAPTGATSVSPSELQALSRVLCSALAPLFSAALDSSAVDSTAAQAAATALPATVTAAFDAAAIPTAAQGVWDAVAVLQLPCEWMPPTPGAANGAAAAAETAPEEDAPQHAPKSPPPFVSSGFTATTADDSAARSSSATAAAGRPPRAPISSTVPSAATSAGTPTGGSGVVCVRTAHASTQAAVAAVQACLADGSLTARCTALLQGLISHQQDWLQQVLHDLALREWAFYLQQWFPHVWEGPFRPELAPLNWAKGMDMSSGSIQRNLQEVDNVVRTRTAKSPEDVAVLAVATACTGYPLVDSVLRALSKGGSLPPCAPPSGFLPDSISMQSATMGMAQTLAALTSFSEGPYTPLAITAEPCVPPPLVDFAQHPALRLLASFPGQYTQLPWGKGLLALVHASPMLKGALASTCGAPSLLLAHQWALGFMGDAVTPSPHPHSPLSPLSNQAAATLDGSGDFTAAWLAELRAPFTPLPASAGLLAHIHRPWQAALDEFGGDAFAQCLVPSPFAESVSAHVLGRPVGGGSGSPGGGEASQESGKGKPWGWFGKSKGDAKGGSAASTGPQFPLQVAAIPAGKYPQPCVAVSAARKAVLKGVQQAYEVAAAGLQHASAGTLSPPAPPTKAYPAVEMGLPIALPLAKQLRVHRSSKTSTGTRIGTTVSAACAASVSSGGAGSAEDDGASYTGSYASAPVGKGGSTELALTGQNTGEDAYSANKASGHGPEPEEGDVVPGSWAGWGPHAGQGGAGSGETTAQRLMQKVTRSPEGLAQRSSMALWSGGSATWNASGTRSADVVSARVSRGLTSPAFATPGYIATAGGGATQTPPPSSAQMALEKAAADAAASWFGSSKAEDKSPTGPFFIVAEEAVAEVYGTTAGSARVLLRDPSYLRCIGADVVWGCIGGQFLLHDDDAWVLLDMDAQGGAGGSSDSGTPPLAEVLHNPELQLKVYMAEVGSSGLKMVLGKAHLPDVRADGATDAIARLSQYKRWDLTWMHVHRIARLDACNEVLYLLADTPPPPMNSIVAQRDFIMFRHVFSDPLTGAHGIAFRNGQHAAVPERRPFIRGFTLGVVGFMVKSQSGGAACDVTFTTAANMKGSIPSFLVNFVAKRTPVMWVTRLKAAVKRFAQE